MKKFVLLTLFVSSSILSVFANWKLTVLQKNQLKQLKFEHLETRKVETSDFYQEILIPIDSDSILSHNERSLLRIRFSKKDKWGMMNGDFKTLIKPKFDAIEILVNQNSTISTKINHEIQVYLGLLKSKWVIYDQNLKNIDEGGFSSVQSIGMNVLSPTILSQQELNCILKDQGNHKIYNFHNSPLFILSKNGYVRKKHVDFKIMEAQTWFDSNGNEEYRYNWIDRMEYFYQIHGGKWNIFEVNKSQFVSRNWVDSVKLIYVQFKTNEKKLNIQIPLDSFYSNQLNVLMLNYNNLTYDSLYFYLNEWGNSNNFLYSMPFFVLCKDNIEKLLDLSAPNTHFPALTKPVIIYPTNSGAHFIGIRENNKLRFFDLLKHEYYRTEFDMFYPHDNVEISIDPYQSSTLSCTKTIKNQKLCVYCFSNDSFYGINKFEDVDFQQSPYFNPIQFYVDKNLFFICKYLGKWGVSTINICGDRDSVLVPFEYDSLIFDSYNIHGQYFRYLKAKQSNQWFNIGLQNNPIVSFPDQNCENVLLLKSFYDEGHEMMTDYYILTNPQGKHVKRSLIQSKSIISDVHENQLNPSDPSFNSVVGGKTLVYNHFMRKVVDELLYDSIWLISTQEDDENYPLGYQNFVYYNYFNWTRSEDIKNMMTSYNYFTIPYFLIFKNGENAIISDKNKIIVPFTKEKIEVSRVRSRDVTYKKMESENRLEEDMEYEETIYESKFVFKTNNKTYSVDEF